jgi:phage portal protein BeeE
VFGKVNQQVARMSAAICGGTGTARGSSIAQWLSPQFGVTIDTDRIDALAADRAALWDRVSNAAFLTLNEKREAVGYGPVAGGDRWG